MATRVPEYIGKLHGEKRRAAIHEWRIQVHRHRRAIGLVVLAGLLVASAFVAIPSLLVGIGIGSATTYAFMHDRKIGFHQNLLEEIGG